MPVKENPTVKVKCSCGWDVIVAVKPATAYIKSTPYRCICGKKYTIRDYMNGIITYMEN